MKIFKNETFLSVLYLILAFVMGICIFAFSIFTTLRLTVFTPGFLSETLNQSEYYTDLCDEITDSLMDIGDASGLDKSFFDNFVDEVLVREDVQSYIDAFYSGNSLKVDSSNFEKALKAALEKYEEDNGLDKKDFSEENINYFVEEASKIYVQNVELNYFPYIQEKAIKYTSKLNIYIAVTGVVMLISLLLIIFTNKWKHIAVRYIYYGTASSGLFMLLIPIVVFLSGVIDRITILTRSLNDMYTACINSVFTVILTVAILLIVVSALLWILHNVLRKRALN
ncbi:MAG: hypothetical protein J1E41_04025 [Ruminococcus sp.]|nr:hypothetical protein [Ruminococcus sp.]